MAIFGPCVAEDQTLLSVADVKPARCRIDTRSVGDAKAPRKFVQTAIDSQVIDAAEGLFLRLPGNMHRANQKASVRERYPVIQAQIEVAVIDTRKDLTVACIGVDELDRFLERNNQTAPSTQRQRAKWRGESKRRAVRIDGIDAQDQTTATIEQPQSLLRRVPDRTFTELGGEGPDPRRQTDLSH
ncbi:MAG: hypothetical protein RL322_1721 [Pseudomonadota bacterium]